MCWLLDVRWFGRSAAVVPTQSLARRLLTGASS
jgi:hypothetical protein